MKYISKPKGKRDMKSWQCYKRHCFGYIEIWYNPEAFPAILVYQSKTGKYIRKQYDSAT